MRNGKHLIVGALCGILSTLVGVSLAKADCAHDEHELNVWRAEAICDEAVQGWIENDQLPMTAINGEHGWDGMWEACMRLSVPVTVLPAAQHYDTADGAFWQGADR